MPNWKDKMKENHEKHSEEVREVVNFEQEKKYFETNKDMLQNKIVSLQQELVEEKELEILLDGKDVKKEEELKKIRDFIENYNTQKQKKNNVLMKYILFYSEFFNFNSVTHI